MNRCYPIAPACCTADCRPSSATGLLQPVRRLRLFSCVRGIMVNILCRKLQLVVSSKRRALAAKSFLYCNDNDFFSVSILCQNTGTVSTNFHSLHLYGVLIAYRGALWERTKNTNYPLWAWGLHLELLALRPSSLTAWWNRRSSVKACSRSALSRVSLILLLWTTVAINI